MTLNFHLAAARLLLTLAALAALPALAAPPLLVPYKGPLAKSAATREFTSQGAAVQFNLAALKALAPGDEVELALPNGRVHTLVFEQLQEHGDGIVSWVGSLKGVNEKLRAVITTGPGGSYGRISTPDGDYQLTPGPGHDWLIDMVEEQKYLPPIDLKKDTRHPPPLPKSFAPQMFAPEFIPPDRPVAGKVGTITSNAAPAGVVVDLMFVYTNGLSARLGANLMTRLNQLVASANVAFADSEVGITLRLVATTMVNYSDLVDSGTALDAITPVVDPTTGIRGGVGVFSNIEALRTTNGADMVAFLRDGPSFGGDGIAWMGPAMATTNNFPAYMYSVTTGCTAGCDWVLIHELGHNIGNAHDRATSAWQNGGIPDSGSYSYSFGYYSCTNGRLALSCAAFSGACGSQPECNTPASGTNNFADIMAYFHGSTLRNIKFSNPALTCRGALNILQPCGSNVGQPDEANAALSMNNNRVGLSATKATMVPLTTPSTTVVASSLNPSVFGQSVTFTATVTAIAGTPAGTVDFRANGTTLATCGSVALATGVATCSTTALAAGALSITAVYSGNATYTTSTSNALTQNVTALPVATTTLGSSLNPANQGVGVTLLATVSGAAGTPTGTVTFRNNGTIMPGCNAVALSGGTASCAATAAGAGLFSVGTPLITATYSGSAGYSAGSAATLFQVILAVPAGPQNVAFAAAGAIATASSVYGPGLPVSAAINGERAGANWLNGSGWNDATSGVYPDWLQVQFNGSRTIDRVVVYTLQDAYYAPSEPTDSMTFTAYGITDFTIQGWNGSAWVVLGTVTGNNLVKRTVTFAAFTTDRIRVNITNGRGAFAHITEVEAFTAALAAPPGPSANVALASNGGVASASSVYGPQLPVAAVNNGERAGANWLNGSGWNDATSGAYPDWVQVNFAGTRTLDRVVVYTLQDAYYAAVEPSDAMTFSLYGITDFTVQGWNGSAWVVLGTVTGNSLVKRTVTFAAFTTDRIRINITSGRGVYSHVTEIEAWTVGTTPPPTQSNVALASNGGVASASSVYGAQLPVAAVNNGERAGANWLNGSGWNDATSGVYPDWVQVNFAGSRTLDRVVVYTLQDAYYAAVEPTDAMTFSLYGITDFTVEGWNGSTWVVLGTVAGNTLVKRTVTFAPFATDRIRINITNGRGVYSHVTEIEAWGS